MEPVRLSAALWPEILEKTESLAAVAAEIAKEQGFASPAGPAVDLGIDAITVRLSVKHAKLLGGQANLQAYLADYKKIRGAVFRHLISSRPQPTEHDVRSAFVAAAFELERFPAMSDDLALRCYRQTVSQFANQLLSESLHARGQGAMHAATWRDVHTGADVAARRLIVNTSRMQAVLVQLGSTVLLAAHDFFDGQWKSAVLAAGIVMAVWSVGWQVQQERPWYFFSEGRKAGKPEAPSGPSESSPGRDPGR